MKKIFIPIVIIFIILSFSGCSNKNVNESQILSDLKKIDYSEYAFQSSFTTQSEYSYTSEKLIKRQTNPENKEDIIFYDVQMNNDYFQINLSVKLIYNYYDEGGWVLDEHFIERTKVEPTAFPATELIAEYLSLEDSVFNYIDNTKTNYRQNNNLIHFCKSNNNIEWESLDKTKGMATFNINAVVDDFATITGSMDIYFDEDNGWTFFSDTTNSLFNIESKTFNYDSSCTGKFRTTFKFAHTNLFEVEYTYSTHEYQIENININTERIELDDGFFEFDPLTVNGFMTYLNNDKYWYYSTSDNTWNWGDQKYIKVDQ